MRNGGFTTEIPEGVSVNGITAAEAAKYETLFNLLDDDGDGCIDEEKLADLMPRLGVFNSEDELHALFAAVDEDGSGAIDFIEFLQLMARYREENQLALLEGGRECFQRLKSASKFTNIARADDPINWFGDTVYLAMVFFHIAVVLYEDLLWKDIPHGPEYFKCFFAVLPLLDIWRGLFTARPPQRSDTLPVDNAKSTRSQYLHSRRFIYDIIGAVPADIIFMFLGMKIEMRIAQHLRLVKIVQIGTVYQRTPRDLISSRYARYLFSVVPLIRMSFWAMLSVHFLSVLWMVMSGSDYMTAMYFIVYTLTTTGFGDVKVISDGEKAFCCFLFCCASVVTGLVAGKLVRLNQQADLDYDVNRRMLETLAAIDHLNVPYDFKQEVLAFQLHRIKHSNSLFHEAISGLPELMQERMALYARMKVVRVVPIFQCAPEICVAKLAQSLVTVFVPPEEYIIIAGEEGEEMFFLFYGMCSVSDVAGCHVATVKRGGVFGEIALLEEGSRRTCSVKTLTYCQLFRLDRLEFDKIVEAFPVLLESILTASESLRMKIATPRHKRAGKARRGFIDGSISPRAVNSPSGSPAASPRAPASWPSLEVSANQYSENGRQLNSPRARSKASGENPKFPHPGGNRDGGLLGGSLVNSGSTGDEARGQSNEVAQLVLPLPDTTAVAQADGPRFSARSGEAHPLHPQETATNEPHGVHSSDRLASLMVLDDANMTSSNVTASDVPDAGSPADDPPAAQPWSLPSVSPSGKAVPLPVQPHGLPHGLGQKPSNQRKSVIYRESMLRETGSRIPPPRSRAGSMESDTSSVRSTGSRGGRNKRNYRKVENALPIAIQPMPSVLPPKQKVKHPERERYENILEKLDQLYRTMIELEKAGAESEEQPVVPQGSGGFSIEVASPSGAHQQHDPEHVPHSPLSPMAPVPALPR
eukprot:TRINITY_DN13778_c0_g1_i1.p1 TRINITY_DN13778_c0_g1~~TRINITY_DN13778_c0_g1_i1.p1  ORF type:complete len:927 (+),score=243.92 TRINITY_DN13778_c0_g1_i1:271-3051(+)